MAANERAESLPPVQSKEWILDPNTEYRFEIDPGSSIAIKLKKGTAEIFGSELANGKWYIFGHECKAAVFTWLGCTLEISHTLLLLCVLHSNAFASILHVLGQPSSEYVSEETPMISYANLALLFEQMRIRAWKKARASPGPPLPPNQSGMPEEPPRVLVIGPESSGKTTACKILTNYAVRTEVGWAPILVNLDTGDGGCTIPGTLSSTPITNPIPTLTPSTPLGSTATSAPTTLTSSALLPLVYWFGHAELRRKVMLMERLIRNLGEGTLARVVDDPKGHAAGLIVDTPAGFTAAPAGEKYRLLKACVEAFKINTILIIGHEKMHVEMQKLYSSGSSIVVMKIPKSGGVVEVDQPYRERVINLQLRTYMYGLKIPLLPGMGVNSLGGEGVSDMSLAPHSSVIGFDDLTIYRIGEESMAPQSALPIGAQRIISETQPVLIDPSTPGSGLLNAVLALLSPREGEKNDYDEEVLDMDVMGFLIVTALDLGNRKMTILAPGPGGVVGRIALIGSFEWQEL